MSDREKDLQAEELADLARRLEAALEVEAPGAHREKALFVAGAAARRRSPAWSGALAPAAAVVVVLVVLALVSRTAQPGETLYPVRQVLGGVGLAPSTAREIRTQLDRAEELVAQAAASATTSPERAKSLAFDADATLERAERLVDELDGARQEAFENEIEALEERADAAYDAADDALDEREDEDDSSGSGSGEDDDSSGPGSGSDDSSGSGSGGGDSSGKGSGSDD